MSDADLKASYLAKLKKKDYGSITDEERRYVRGELGSIVMGATGGSIAKPFQSRINMLANRPLRKGEELASTIADRIVHQKAIAQDVNKIRDKYGFLIKRRK